MIYFNFKDDIIMTSLPNNPGNQYHLSLSSAWSSTHAIPSLIKCSYMHCGCGHTAITQITLTKTFLTLISVHPRSLTNDDTETYAVAY